MQTKSKSTISVSLAMTIHIFLRNQTRNNFKFVRSKTLVAQVSFDQLGLSWTLADYLLTSFEVKNFENIIRNAFAVNVLPMKSFKMASAMRSSSKYLIELI